MTHDDGPPTLPQGVEAVRSPSSLEYMNLEAGETPAAKDGSDVRVHYRCWLTEGTLIEDTWAQGEPLEMHVGGGDVIPGLEEGVSGLGAGGKRRLIVPSDLAYGPRGFGSKVPPYATLIYDIEIITVR